MQVSLPAALVLACLLLVSGPAPAGEKTTEEPPSQELLEFLADWETASGKWIDPTCLEEIPLPKDEGENDDAEKARDSS